MLGMLTCCSCAMQFFAIFVSKIVTCAIRLTADKTICITAFSIADVVLRMTITNFIGMVIVLT